MIDAESAVRKVDLECPDDGSVLVSRELAGGVDSKGHVHGEQRSEVPLFHLFGSGEIGDVGHCLAGERLVEDVIAGEPPPDELGVVAVDDPMLEVPDLESHHSVRRHARSQRVVEDGASFSGQWHEVLLQIGRFEKRLDTDLRDDFRLRTASFNVRSFEF